MHPRHGILAFVVAAALAWQGFLLALPHDHHQDGVTRRVASCALVGAPTYNHHLHRPPQPVAPDHCLACLAGHALPLSRGRVMCTAPAPAANQAVAPVTLLAISAGLVLPNRRGPPTSA